VVRKIISGEQTGADRAGLDFAIEVGLEHGGFVPRGRRAEDGRISEHYHLTEFSSVSFAVRTTRNVREGDGTVVFSLGAALKEQAIRSGGAQGTELLAQAVTAYRSALEVYTREVSPAYHELVEANLAEAENRLIQTKDPH
jgi:hypothetical protein